MGGDYLHSPDPLWLGLKARRRTPPRENPAPFGQPRERMDGGGPGASGERRAEISLVLAGNSRRQGGRVSLGTLETRKVYIACKSIRPPPATALPCGARTLARGAEVSPLNDATANTQALFYESGTICCGSAGRRRTRRATAMRRRRSCHHRRSGPASQGTAPMPVRTRRKLTSRCSGAG